MSAIWIRIEDMEIHWDKDKLEYSVSFHVNGTPIEVIPENLPEDFCIPVEYDEEGAS